MIQFKTKPIPLNDTIYDIYCEWIDNYYFKIYLKMLRTIGSKAKSFSAFIARNFHLHEYQSKDIMREFGITVQKGGIALTPEEAYNVSKPLNPAGGLIVKAQVHAGGRGKGKLTSGLKGGVQICKTPEEVANYTKQMIGYNLITKQTKAEGNIRIMNFHRSPR